MMNKKESQQFHNKGHQKCQRQLFNIVEEKKTQNSFSMDSPYYYLNNFGNDNANNSSNLIKGQKNYTSPSKNNLCTLNFEKLGKQQSTLTPFSKFINGLSPISKISKEAANEISNFKNISGSIYANQQKLNYYLQTPSPSNLKQKNAIEANQQIPAVSNNLIQKLDFNECNQMKNNITIIKIQSPIINLNYDRSPEVDLENELNLQQQQEQEQQNNNKNSLDLANLMYEFKFVEGDLQYAKKFKKSYSSSDKDSQKDDIGSSDEDDSELLNQIYMKEEQLQQQQQQQQQQSSSQQYEQDIKKKINFEQYETPKQLRLRELQKSKLFDKQEELQSKSRSSIKTIQKTAQLSEQLNISLNKIVNKNQTTENNDFPTTEKKKIGCNCKKSKCLKLYCECFANGQICTKECNCCDCSNLEDNQDQRYQVMLQLIERNPQAFQPKVDKANQQTQEQHLRGCNCNKSGCIKKYCECYQAGVKCTSLCKCENCKNKDEIQVCKHTIEKVEKNEKYIEKNQQKQSKASDIKKQKDIFIYEKPICKRTRKNY